MFQVEADKSSNLLKINFSGHVDPEQAARCVEKVQTSLADMTEGFRLLTDMTRLDAMDPGCTPHVRKTMDLCNKKGIALVVRVIPDPRKDIGFNILSIFHYRRGVRIVTAETLDEGLKALGDQP